SSYRDLDFGDDFFDVDVGESTVATQADNEGYNVAETIEADLGSQKQAADDSSQESSKRPRATDARKKPASLRSASPETKRGSFATALENVMKERNGYQKSIAEQRLEFNNRELELRTRDLEAKVTEMESKDSGMKIK
ncbi:hypothetical protein DFQ27_002479, partial [Actinomortierella ambigua]